MLNTVKSLTSICTVLTPSIKAKLQTLAPGEVLEVRIDDPTAREDIASWCRLTGHELIAFIEEPAHLVRSSKRSKKG